MALSMSCLMLVITNTSERYDHRGKLRSPLLIIVVSGNTKIFWNYHNRT